MNDAETAQLEDEVGEWSASTNEALTVSLYQGDKRVEAFNPRFTYPIYGDEEVIFGYQGLDIQLAFAAHNLRPHFSYKYKRKFKAQGEIKAGEVKEPIEEFLPDVAFNKETREKALSDSNADTFTPPGDRIETYDTDSGTYETWCSPLSNARTKDILQNMQILVPMFIEGGTMLELEYPWIVDRWKVFLLYKVVSSAPAGSSKYVFVGYATTFQVFTLPDRGAQLDSHLEHMSEPDMDNIIATWNANANSRPSPLTLPSRERISQFIILPSHQKSGLGSRLYSTIYEHLTTPENVIELTVEDPNEDFDDMRDITDFARLRTTNATFQSLKLPGTLPPPSLNPANAIPIPEIVPPQTKDTLAKETKIQSRQLSRMIEMQLLSTIPRLHRSTSRITRKEKASNENDRKFYFWRLLVKERIYAHNRDTLIQLEPDERREKVDLTVDGLVSDYERLTERAEGRIARQKASNGVNGHSNQKSKGIRKRVAIADEDEGKDGVVEDEEESKDDAGPRKKRKRVIDDEDEDEDGVEMTPQFDRRYGQISALRSDIITGTNGPRPDPGRRSFNHWALFTQIFGRVIITIAFLSWMVLQAAICLFNDHYASDASPDPGNLDDPQ